jgi:hypothetical protein
MLVSRISPVELGTDPARAPDGIISGYSPGTRPLATYPTRHLCQMREAAAFLSNSVASFCPGDLLTLPGCLIQKESRRECNRRRRQMGFLLARK